MAPTRLLQPSGRRIRARTGGRWLLDTTDAHVLFEPDRHPALLVPVGLVPLGRDGLGPADQLDGRWRDLEPPWEGRARVWPTPPVDLPDLGRLAGLPSTAAAEWFEEDEPFLAEVRDPFRRVDVLESSREVVISVDGLDVARSSRPRLVLETGMPPLWYVPLADLEAAHLRASPLRTRCQYKGEANYWHLRTDRTHHDLVWGYPCPIPTAGKLAGYVCVTPWSPDVVTAVDGEIVHCDGPTDGWANPLLSAVTRR